MDIIFAFVAFCFSNAQVETSIFPAGKEFEEFPMLYKVNIEDILLYEMPGFNLDSVLQYEYDQFGGI